MSQNYFSINMRLLMLIFLLAIGVSTNAQTFQWINSQPINYSYNPDMLNYVVCTDENGDIMHAGMKAFNLNYSGMYGDLFLKKYNPDGTLLFEEEITGSAMVRHIETRNGRYFLTGEFKGDLVFPGQQILYANGVSSEFFFAILSADGSAEQLINLSTAFENLNEIGFFTTDEYSNIYLPLSTWSNSMIVKMDLYGNTLQTILQENVAMVNSIDFDPYGNIVVSGAFANTVSYFAGEMYQPNTQDNMYVAKYSAEGENMWVTFIEDVIYTLHNQIKCDHSGNIYFSGFLFGQVNFGPFQAHGPEWVYDFFLAKMNGNGQFLWLNEVPEQTTIAGDATVGKLGFLDVDAQDNVYVSGFVRGTIDWGNGVVSTGNNYYDLLLLQFSPAGEIQWSRSGGSDSFVKSINLSVDHEGNCYMAGVGGGDMTFGNITHYQEGFVYPILVKLENVLSVGINNNSESENTVSIFPNPANNYFTYSSSSGHNNPTKVTIFNQYGKQIHTGSYGPMQQISTSGYASGIYFIEFTMQDGYKVIEKLTAN